MRLRRLLGRLPAAGWACTAIAFANFAVWALVTPPLQVPDEIAHYAYVQYVGEWSDIPTSHPRPGASGIVSEELSLAADAVPWTIEARPTWFPDALREFRESDDELGRKSASVPPSTVNHPPLYYALEAVPYRVARSADIFDRLLVLRLFSALLGAITVAFTFLLVRELLPRRPWAAVVGALAVAFQPIFGFMSGGVNNDNLLYTLGAVLIYLTARAMRRGLTWQLAVALGLVATAGMLTKTSFAGLLPGAALGALIGVWRLPEPARRRALVAVGVGALAFVVPFGLWLVANQSVFDRTASTTTGGFTSSAVTQGTSVSGHLSYVWQAFLPALPGMRDFPPVADMYIPWDVYVQGFVGRFGWWRFGFPMWVNWVGLAVYASLAGLAGVALVRARAALRGRWPELVALGAIAAGLVLLVEVAAYRYQHTTATPFEQARYLLPLVSLYGLVVAVAPTALGRRWGPAAGAFVVVLAMAHSLFAMLLVVGHYYA